MAKVEKAAKFMEQIAADNSHGYDQLHRWGTPDYDCSSLVISAYEQAGVKVKTAGATYTGNMYNVFLRCGFKDVTSTVNRQTGSGMKRGDVLLNTQHHTAMYVGDGKLVEANINEKGGIYNGKPGDQTGHEIHKRSYYSYPWDYVLRYPEVVEKKALDTEGYKRGDKDLGVYALKCRLIALGYSMKDDQGYGSGTEKAVNALLKSWGYKPNGVAGEKFLKKVMKNS